MIALDALNPQQRLAVETLQGPVLILAGAGTGKTRVITHRIAHMIDRGIAPGAILAVTFTNKAAREMLERVNGLVPSLRRPRGEAALAVKPPRPTVCTFHSLCVRILRAHIDRLGFKRNFVIFSESDQLGAMKKILARVSVAAEKVDPAEVLQWLSREKNGSHSRYDLDPGRAALFNHLRQHYESALRACNAVDFDDLILYALRLFREFPEVLEECRARYRYVMVDEYQDTNAAQFELVRTLTFEHRNLCVVGDDDQSIYGWRGAEIANLLELEKHYPEVKVIKLEQNYRSTNTILTVANAVIRHNPRRRGKQLWSRHGHGVKVALCACDTDEAEAQGVVEAIEYDRLAHHIPWADQAILFRTNAQSRPLEMSLRRAGVRYHLIGGQSFFDRREIKDVIAYLRLFLNPHDDVSLLRIANVPARGLSDVTMERLLAASQQHRGSVYAAMSRPDVQQELPTRARESLLAFLALIDRVRGPLLQENALGLTPWAERFLADIGYLEDLRHSEKDPDNAENRVRNLKEMLATMDQAADGIAAHKPADRLEAFLQDLMLDGERESEKERDPQAVTLITMHSCKGLEFPHVHIVGLEDGLLPHTRSKEEGTLDEERRLFYVAITRAMKTLRLSHCAGRKKYGQMTPCHPSPFLRELPPEHIEHVDAHERKPVTVEVGKNLFSGMRAALES
jgi:superfamily I DNA/RNA helicase